MSFIRKITLLLTTLILFFALGLCNACTVNGSNEQTKYNNFLPGNKMNSIFINSSAHPGGNTANLAAILLKNKEYKTINLQQLHINQLNQNNNDDFLQLFSDIKLIKNLIFGTPVYWSDMSGYMKTFIDRLADTTDSYPMDSPSSPLYGKDFYLVVTGTDPSDAVNHIAYVWKHVCNRFHMNFKGLVDNTITAEQLNASFN